MAQVLDQEAELSDRDTRQMMRTLETAMRVRTIFIVLAVVLAALHTWAGRYAMDPDGISYFDMADAFARHDWAMAVNRLWSPLFPFLLGVVMAIFRPGPQGEFAFAHYVNFVVFLASLVSFDFFLRQLLKFRETQLEANVRRERIPISPEGIVAIGYVIFIWSALNLATMLDIDPDQAVATFAYLAAGLFLRTRMQPAGWSSFALLGCALGLGYLAKAPMVIAALVFFALAVWRVPHGVADRISQAGLALRVAVAIVAFSVVVSPLVYAFFRINGRITIGDSARLNYAWHVDRLPLVHWQGQPGDRGAPRHPTRMISVVPAAYEFATPVRGTYPPWFDPAYWNEGVVPRFDARGHLWAVLRSIKVTSLHAAVYHWVPSVGVLALLVAYMRRKGWVSIRDVAAYSGVWMPAAVAFAAFSLIRLEPRYVEAFATLLWLGIVAGLTFPAGAEGQVASRKFVATVLIVHFVLITASSSLPLTLTGKSLLEGSSASSSVNWRVAEGLMRMGVKPGDKVAIIGRGAFAYWARLARVRIIGEIPVASESDFWAADTHVRQRILDTFASVGAKIAVLPPPEARRRDMRSQVDVSAMGWLRVGDTGYYAMPLVK